MLNISYSFIHLSKLSSTEENNLCHPHPLTERITDGAGSFPPPGVAWGYRGSLLGHSSWAGASLNLPPCSLQHQSLQGCSLSTWQCPGRSQNAKCKGSGWFSQGSSCYILGYWSSQSGRTRSDLCTQPLCRACGNALGAVSLKHWTSGNQASTILILNLKVWAFKWMTHSRSLSPPGSKCLTYFEARLMLPVVNLWSEWAEN